MIATEAERGRWRGRRPRRRIPAAVPITPTSPTRAAGGAAREKKRGPAGACGRAVCGARRRADVRRHGRRARRRRRASVARAARRAAARACLAEPAAVRSRRRERGCAPGASRGRRRGRPGARARLCRRRRGGSWRCRSRRRRIGSLEVSTTNAGSATARGSARRSRAPPRAGSPAGGSQNSSPPNRAGTS